MAPVDEETRSRLRGGAARRARRARRADDEQPRRWRAAARARATRSSSEFEPRSDDPRASPRTAEEQQQLDEFLDRLEEANPYQLDGAGQLYLPGVPAIPLAGLNVDEATVRVQAETALRPFTIIVTFLPLEPVGIAALEPFGYDLFERSRRAFAPDTDIPVPADYVIGPGDTDQYSALRQPEHRVFPRRQPRGNDQLSRDRPDQRQRPDVRGDARHAQPARHGADDRRAREHHARRAALDPRVRARRRRAARLVHRQRAFDDHERAATRAAACKPIGSLRNIALRRDGTTMSTLDLYDLLLRGDTRGDVRLQPGDAIFVPPIGATVTVDGEVRRPAIYEVKNEESVAELVALAGGLNANANRAAVKLERVVPNRGTTVQDLDLAGGGAQTAVRDGDVLRVPPNLEQLENSVRLAGNVFQPGLYQWRQGMRLRDLLPAPELVKPMSDLNYVLIRRELAPNVDIEAMSADLQAAWRQPNGAANVASAAARHGVRVPPRNGPAGDPRADHRGARGAGGAERAAAGRARRRTGAGAGRISARARHARQRPAARRRRVERGRVRHRRRAHALRRRRRRVSRDGAHDRQSRGRAARRRCRRPRASGPTTT